MATTKNQSKEIDLVVRGKHFKISKHVLCEYSLFFSGLFCSNYVHKGTTAFEIEVIHPDAMDILMKYMNAGSINLSEYRLQTVGNLAKAAQYFRMTELIKQIKSWLNFQLCVSNWVEISCIAKNAAYIDILDVLAVYGLMAFKDMRPEYIPDVQTLVWYLSHPSLATDSELNVFKFGCNWIEHLKHHPSADIYLLLLGCLDIRKLTIQDLKEISLLMKDCENSMADGVVQCLKMLADYKLDLTVQVMNDQSNLLLVPFSKSVFKETYKLIYFSKQRKLVYTPLVSVWFYKDGEIEPTHHNLYKYCNQNGFKLWLTIANQEMWGWNMATWGATNLIQVCGENGRGRGQFMKDVRVFDTLRKQWTEHGVKLPCRRHAGVTVLGDLLFIIGGVDGFLEFQDTTIIYNLKARTHKLGANFPDAIQSPATCTHYGSVYAAGHKNVYVYDDTREKHVWTLTLTTANTINHMLSFKDYIYCSQNGFNNMYRFRPGIDEKLETVTKLTASPAAFCGYKDSLMLFTKPAAGASEEMKVALYNGPCICPEKVCRPGLSCDPLVFFTKKDAAVNEVAGALSLVVNMPITENSLTEYHKLYVVEFGSITYND